MYEIKYCRMIRKHINFLIYMAVMACVVLCAGCADGLFGEDGTQHSTRRIELSGEIYQEAVTRIDDNGFCDGDGIGVYIVDYKAGTPGTLQQSGNRADNVCYTYRAANSKWYSYYDVYWKDLNTHIDVYGYYPYANPESIDNYTFMVQRDQSTASSDGKMGGYEASDFLWGKLTDAAPTSAALRLQLRHRMSRVLVDFERGEGFTQSEWLSTSKFVLVTNLSRKASINMKVTGSVNANDFFFMRDYMPWLTDLNLKNVRIERVEISGIVNGHVAKYADDELPNECFHNKKTLRSVVLPDVLGRIGNNAFHNAGLTGSLNVPEGVEEIGHDAFVGNDLIGILTLPSTLKKMGSFAFGGCGFVCPLNLPNGLEEIGDGCFSDCQNLYGKLILPSRLKKLGVRAFHNCQALEGDLVIPKYLTVIPDSAFMDCKLGGRLQLHDGITSIGNHAFAGNGFKDGLALPNRLKVLEGGNFIGNNFSGSLKIPTGLLRISEEAFAGCTFTGDVEIPEGIMHLHKRAFAGSENLQKIILPSDLELIDEEAFRDCKSLRVIECKSIFPPVVKKSAFSGVPLQDITVMVPESALNDYKQSGSWSAFGRIIAKTK